MIRLSRPNCPHPKSLEKKTTYKHERNKEALLASSNGKCMYCETLLSHAQFGDVEHIMPKGDYPALEFTWDNLGISCSKCNNSKSDKFDPDCPIIDPYKEDPSDFLVAVGGLVFAKPGELRGQMTVELVELNRAQLVARRSEKVEDVNRLVERISIQRHGILRDAAKNILISETAPDKEYSFVSRAAAELLLKHV